MKNNLLILILITVLLLVGCRADNPVNTASDITVSPATPTPVSTISTDVITDTDVTPAIVSPDALAKSEHGNTFPESSVITYDKFEGLWYQYSTDVDGNFTLAADSGIISTLLFYEDEPSVTKISKNSFDTEEDTIIWTSKNVAEITDSAYNGYMLHADYSDNGNYFHTPDDLDGFDYFFDENGNLVEYYIVFSEDGTSKGVRTVYTREAP